jgi:isoleucyl-tRNA synthetase
MLSPISSFTAEEAWQHVPGREVPSVFLAGLPAPEPALIDDALEEEFRELAALRVAVNVALEQKRVAKEIGKATEADIVLRLAADSSPALREVIEKYEKQLADLFLCASVRVEPGDAGGALQAIVEKSANTPCERCWRALPEVAASDRHLCARCAKAVA